MQGQRSSLTTLPDTVGFDHGSTSSDDSHVSWTSLHAVTENQVQDYVLSSGDTNSQYLHHGVLNSQWTLGESSSQNQPDHTERKREQSWSMNSPPARNLDAVEANQIEHRLISGPTAVSQDLNISSNIQMPHTGSSSGVPLLSLDSQRVPCKRKALDIQTGQSSASGSLSFNEHSGSSSLPQPSNAGLRLGVGGAVSDASRRNLRLRFNSFHHLEHPPVPTEVNLENLNVQSSPHLSRLPLRNHMGDLQPPPVFENGGRFSPSLLSHVRNPQTRWTVGTSSTRTIPEHPVFSPATDIGSSSQQPQRWNFPCGGTVASTSRAALNLSPHWSHPQYPRRITEIFRRSMSSSIDFESGGRNNVVQPNPSSISPETARSSVSNLRGALLERHLDGAFALPRRLAAATEGRSGIMSEIRRVLDIMRRGESLRVEDMMILDQSVFFGMGDALDRHHDMRMDVDNMSYEELLALGERIGDVCTGLNEEKIMKLLKQRKYPNRSKNETEPCSICREEYKDGEDLGILDCGHDFHRECIKQWLMQKNLCPICKMTGLTK